MLSPTLPALPSTPMEENHGELGICLHHQSPPGANEESGEIELHEIRAGTVCWDADACRIAVELPRAVAVGGRLGLGVGEGFIYWGHSSGVVALGPSLSKVGSRTNEFQLCSLPFPALYNTDKHCMELI